jgi:uncharacterized membrane protein
VPFHKNQVKQNRLFAVDSLRGLAMVLVILQHAYLSVNRQLIPPLLDMFLWGLTYIAAIAFVSISGMMCSYFFNTQTNWKLPYRRYVARAIFLIFGAHLAINLTSYYFRVTGGSDWLISHSSVEQFFLGSPITDTIGFCLLMAPVFIIYWSPAQRAVAIVLMLVATAIIRAFVIPTGPYWTILNEATFGVLGEPKLFWVPLVPWFAVFLTGSFIGKALACLKSGEINLPTLIQKMNKTAIVFAISGAIFTLCYKLLRIVFGGVLSPNLFLAIYPGQTTTLLPGYLSMLLWLFSALIQHIDIHGCYDRFTWFLSVFGRTSLFTFIVQFAVAESIPALMGLKGSLGLAGFLFLFGTSTIVMWLLSYLYGRLRGWITKRDYEEILSLVAGRVTTKIP